MSLQFVKDRFAKKTVIVTGAGAGIGRACVVRLVNEGARVIATDVLAARLEDLKKQLQGFDVVTVTGDISLEATTQAIMAETQGKVDALVNNAGIMDGFLPAAEIDDATWEKVFAVNVTAIMRLTRAVLPLMLKVQKGSIVNISSEAGFRGACAGAAYTSSKHAVIGYTKNTAFMYGSQGIRTNVVTPGAVKTSIEAPFKSKLAGEKLGPVFQALVKNAAEPEDLAACITWLCSDDSPNINGAVLSSDGGWSAI